METDRNYKTFLYQKCIIQGEENIKLKKNIFRKMKNIIK